ncbi:Hint domain-containing protein [Humitalea sp. 24SJ18S-53]|uniref:Hint domain-containing protein n=1 Tax=Humitalea sp. 24SJ18S-53 TaxID=3422307 RepID=UPI003D67EBA7
MGIAGGIYSYSADGNVPTSDLILQYSDDDGETWTDLAVTNVDTNGTDTTDQPVTWSFTPLAAGSYDFRVEGQGLNPGGQDAGSPIYSGTLEDIDVVCFLAGTLIATPDGEVAVEALSIGDLVLTADGRAVPVMWLGQQTVATIFGMPEARRPVVIRAGALGDNLPRRDLRVTSDHAMMIEGVLVQAGALVNGASIQRIPLAELGDRFTVFHIETEHHEIVLAEGAATETFIDNVTRARFDNFAEFVALFAAEGRPMQELDHPRTMSHRQVPVAIRARIAARAAVLEGRDAVAA